MRVLAEAVMAQTYMNGVIQFLRDVNAGSSPETGKRSFALLLNEEPV